MHSDITTRTVESMTNKHNTASQSQTQHGHLRHVDLVLHGAVLFDDPLSASSNPNVMHLTGLVAVSSLPNDLPNDPNARPAKISSPVSKKVYKSLVSDDGQFHLKNKGITMLAFSAKDLGSGRYSVGIRSGLDGIADGGHTYALVQKARASGFALSNQYVPVSIRIGCPRSYLAGICEGLNTGTQVKVSSLTHRTGLFEWLKDLLIKNNIPATIAWTENAPGQWKAADLISVITCVHPRLAPKGSHPTSTYSQANVTSLKYNEQHGEYVALEKAVVPALRLVDVISVELAAALLHADPVTSLRLASGVKMKTHLFDTSVRVNEPRLIRAVYLPTIAAFRQLIVKGHGGELVFDRDEKSLVSLYRQLEPTFVEIVLAHFRSCGENPNDLGKSVNFWQAMYDVVSPKAPVARVCTNLTPAELDEYKAFYEEEYDNTSQKIGSAWDDEDHDLRRQLGVMLVCIERVLKLFLNDEFGLCITCKGDVEEERLAEAISAEQCRRCAGIPLVAL